MSEQKHAGWVPLPGLNERPALTVRLKITGGWLIHSHNGGMVFIEDPGHSNPPQALED